MVYALVLFCGFAHFGIAHRPDMPALLSGPVLKQAHEKVACCTAGGLAGYSQFSSGSAQYEMHRSALRLLREAHERGFQRHVVTGHARSSIEPWGESAGTATL